MRRFYFSILLLLPGMFSNLSAQISHTIGETFAYQVGDTLIYDCGFSDIYISCSVCSAQYFSGRRFNGFTVTDKKQFGDSVLYEMKMLPSEIKDTFIISSIDSPMTSNNSMHLGKFHELITGNSCLTECALSNSPGCSQPYLSSSTINDTTGLINTLSPTRYHYPNLDLDWGFISIDSGGIFYFNLTQAPFGSNNPFTINCYYRLVYWSTSTINYGVFPYMKPVGVADIFTSSSYQIQPNPFKSHFDLKIDNTDADNVSATVINTQGEVLFTKTNLSQLTTFDLSNYVDGVYFLKVSSGNSSEVRKLIKY